eukprot:30087-Pelagococcus_subviridis.AAC.13
MHCSSRFAPRLVNARCAVHNSSPPTNSPCTTSMPKRHCTTSPRSPLPMTRTIEPPPIVPASGTSAYTTAEDPYANTASDVPHTSSLALTATGTKPPSRAGVAHSTPAPAAREFNGPIDHPHDRAAVLRSLARVQSEHDRLVGVVVHRAAVAELLPVIARAQLDGDAARAVRGSFALHERRRHRLRGRRLGGSESAERLGADEVFAADFYHADARGRTRRRLQRAHHGRGLEPEHELARAETLAYGADFDGDEAGSVRWPAAVPLICSCAEHSSSPPTYSPFTTSKPNLHCTTSPRMRLPMTRTIDPPPTGPASGTTANTSAEDPYSNTASDVPHTSSFWLAATAVIPTSCAGAAHSAPNPAMRPASGPIVPNLHVASA